MWHINPAQAGTDAADTLSAAAARLPEEFHTAANAALKKAMPRRSIFEPRQDVVIIFKQVHS